MADLSDVEVTLATFVSATLYPNGTTQPSVIAGNPVIDVERGWPNAPALDAALAAGKVTVSVYAQQSAERVTTRFQTQWQLKSGAAPTLTVSVSGYQATLNGTPSATQVVMVALNQQTYAYQCVLGDTLLTVAANVAALVPGAIASGPSIIISGGQGFRVRISAQGIMIREVRRQERGFQIVVWAPTPAQRDAVASVVDSAFAAITILDLPDGFGAKIAYLRTFTSDSEQNAALYRRDLFYCVEYATTQTMPAYQVAAIPVDWFASQGTTLPTPTVTTVY